MNQSFSVFTKQNLNVLGFNAVKKEHLNNKFVLDYPLWDFHILTE